jgi:hypothetical protein
MMRGATWRWLTVAALGLGGCFDDNAGVVTPDAGTVDAGAPNDLGVATDAPVADAGAADVPRPDAGPVVCVDTDGDGVSDADEGPPTRDSDGDGMPDYMDRDSDNDGFEDGVEARRAYPGYDDRARGYVCGATLPPDECDGPPDGLANFRDPDSDNDGLTDAEERTAGTNPCAEDTDRDGASDLVEVVARSNPRDESSRPPPESLYVTVPYYAPDQRGPVERREFTFQTRIQRADVFLLVDNSASMDSTIDTLRESLRTVIVPGIRAQVTDVRIGVGSFDSMPERAEGEREVEGFPTDGEAGRPGDYTLWRRQRMTRDFDAVQRAFDAMRTIAVDTNNRYLGGFAAECQVEALYQVVTGAGSRTHEMSEAARRSTLNARDPMGSGWAGAMNPLQDCDDPTERGWGCFGRGRVPIVVLFSDGPWFDGPLPSSPRSQRGYRYAELVPAMNALGALFVGIDVSMAGRMGFTFANSAYLARATGSLSAQRQEVLFAPVASGGIARTAADIVSGIRTLAEETRQDIRTEVDSPASDMRLPMGRRAGDFVRAVRPARGEPAAPTGYERQDDRTFYGVLPSTRVTFAVEFYNDFAVGGDTAQVFQASIVVRGRAGSEVDRRPLFIVVPARGGGLPPG